MSTSNVIGGIGPAIPGTAGGGIVTSVTATAPLTSSGGATPNIAIAPVGQTRGDILARGASAWIRIPAGTAGQVLSTNGTTADATWISLPVPVLVFDPTGVASGNVYTSFAAIATASAAIIGPKVIYVRLRGADRTVPAGAYNFGYHPVFTGDADDAPDFGLIFPTGATMADWPAEVSDLLIYSDSVNPIVTITNASNRVYRFTGYGQMDARTAANMYVDSGTASVIIFMSDRAAWFSEGGGRCFVTAGSFFMNAFNAPYADDNTFYGTAATSLFRLTDASQISITQTGGAAITVGNFAQSAQVAFVPAVSAQWSPVPDNDKDALDQLAARSVASGPTASRPASPVTGQYYLDTDLGIPIWYNGGWVNAAGVTV